jgi:hypothetical protein
MLVYDQQQPVRSEIRSFLQFVPLGGARWDISRYPLNIFNSAKRSPRGGLRFPLLNGSNGHRQLHQPIAWIWWKKWCVWENQRILRNLTWISTIKSTKSKKAISDRFFAKNLNKNAPRSSENGGTKTYRRAGGGPYEWTKVALENPTPTSFGDSCIHVKRWVVSVRRRRRKKNKISNAERILTF